MRLAHFIEFRSVALVSISGVAVLIVSSTAIQGRVRYGTFAESPVLANTAEWKLVSKDVALLTSASTSVKRVNGPDDTCGTVRMVDSLVYGEEGALFCWR